MKKKYTVSEECQSIKDLLSPTRHTRVCSHSELEARVRAIETANSRLRQTNAVLIQRLVAIEKRLLGKCRHNWDHLESVTDYLLGAQISGDYAEFGVGSGNTFVLACKALAPFFKNMHFWAFDSFQGLPSPRAGLDEFNGYSGGFHNGQFAISESEFLEEIAEQEVDLSRITLVSGWYRDTLSKTCRKSANPFRISFARIDCNLYESTCGVLDYLTDKILPGAVIQFDNWHCFRNSRDRGQQKACHEWLTRNPHISLNNLMNNALSGRVFTVEIC